MEMETGVSRIPVTATTAMATKVRDGYGLAARGRGCGRGAGGELLLRLLLITSKIHNTIPTSTTFAAGCAMVFYFTQKDIGFLCFMVFCLVLLPYGK